MMSRTSLNLYTAEQEGTKFVRVNNFAEPLTSLLSRIQYTLEPTTDQLVLMLPGDAESAAASFDWHRRRGCPGTPRMPAADVYARNPAAI